MTDTEGRNGTVLVVDDEEDVAEAYSLWLSDEYDVRVSTSGEEAMERLAGADLVLLDRRMPGLSGDEVLERIREEDHSCRVAMVTAVDPDFDIIEMGFDDYITKPVDGGELKEVADRLLRLDSLNEKLSDHFALAQKAAALETEKSPDELESHDRYNEVLEEIEDTKGEIDGEVQDDGLADAMYRDL